MDTMTPSISTSPWFLPRRALASSAWSSFPPPAWQTPTLPLGLSLAFFRSPHATAHSTLPLPRPGAPQSTPSTQLSGCTRRGRGPVPLCVPRPQPQRPGPGSPGAGSASSVPRPRPGLGQCRPCIPADTNRKAWPRRGWPLHTVYNWALGNAFQGSLGRQRWPRTARRWWETSSHWALRLIPEPPPRFHTAPKIMNSLFIPDIKIPEHSDWFTISQHFHF